MQQIETLYLPDSVKSSYQNVENQPLTQLDSLSRVNILVGANNSGKSRFMRLLAVEQIFEIKFQDENINKEYEGLVNIIKSIKNIIDENQTYLIDLKVVSNIKKSLINPNITSKPIMKFCFPKSQNYLLI